MAKIVESIRPGDRVTIVDRFGKQRTGRAVMRGPHGWVLNMGGRAPRASRATTTSPACSPRGAQVRKVASV